MKLYLIEHKNNLILFTYLKNKYNITYNIQNADVVIVNKVYNIKKALDMIDYSLNLGKEIICIKSSFGKENYVSNYLIKNGALFV